MITLGIDPGTATTGFGVIREEPDGSLTVLDYGVIQTKSNLSQAERLVQLYKRIKETYASPPSRYGSGGEVVF